MKFFWMLVLSTLILSPAKPCLQAAVPFLATTSPDAAKAVDKIATPSNRLLRLASAKQLTIVEEAYVDALSILSQENQCSDFFRGSDMAAYALWALFEQMRPRAIHNFETGIEMSGNTIVMVRQSSPVISFRLFSDVRVNTWGPFYRTYNFEKKREHQRIGRFAPNTREARVLMLLHELGHMIAGADGKWLLQDDGRNPFLSDYNTHIVENRCRASILELNKNSSRSLLAALFAVSLQPVTPP